MNFQNKLNKMVSVDPTDFIRAYLLMPSKKILSISEKRHLSEKTLLDSRLIYYVLFEYFIVKDETMFSPKETAKIIIEDPLPFNTKEDAEYYLAHAYCPSTIIFDNYYLSRTIYLKEFINKDITIKARRDYRHSALCFSLSGENYYSGLRHYSDLLIDIVNYIKCEYQYEYPVDNKVISTIEFNDIVNIKKTDIEKLKNEIDEVHNQRSAVILDELERINNYAELLKKLL